MDDGQLAQIILMALGFAYVITKLRKIENIASLSVSLQLGTVVVKTKEDEENEDG